jgi:hypothetical protein
MDTENMTLGVPYRDNAGPIYLTLRSFVQKDIKTYGLGWMLFVNTLLNAVQAGEIGLLLASHTFSYDQALPSV